MKDFTFKAAIGFGLIMSVCCFFVSSVVVGFSTGWNFTQVLIWWGILSGLSFMLSLGMYLMKDYGNKK